MNRLEVLLTTAIAFVTTLTVTGAKLWSYPISDVPNVIVANGKVYASSGGQLYAFGLKSKSN
jgi:outer membrane protein assembly factor BamB